jgi:hypothetical protein
MDEIVAMLEKQLQLLESGKTSLPATSLPSARAAPSREN